MRHGDDLQTVAAQPSDRPQRVLSYFELPFNGGAFAQYLAPRDGLADA
jgi:hypothetical protein